MTWRAELQEQQQRCRQTARRSWHGATTTNQNDEPMPIERCNMVLDYGGCLLDVTKLMAAVGHAGERIPAAAKLVDLNCIRTR